ncbi:MAG: LacI family DNA-binding transcriptional regulator [Caldilineaceae bacterium]|nr:LacI family DNA-binding transcriptional regulator [Caldilineaceae bacterium]
MPPDARATLADIAERVGVSPSTVSLTLRNKPGVSEETRQRVIQGALALGYSLKQIDDANPVDVNTIGVLAKSDGMTNHFYGPVLAGIEAVCRKRQINLLYAHLEVNDENLPVRTPRMLAENSADGLLVAGIWLDETLLGMLRRLDVPLVLVDSYAYSGQYDTVVSDNEDGAYRATRHLIERGHRHIAMIGATPNAYPSILGRRLGYQRAMSEAALPECYADCLPRPAYIEETLNSVLADAPQVTAFACSNDVVAIHTMQLLHRLGKHVPNDFSVTGYDDIDLASHVSPALTTLRVDKARMGRIAVETLLDRLDHPDSASLHAVVAPELIERASVGPPRRR